MERVESLGCPNAATHFENCSRSVLTAAIGRPIQIAIAAKGYAAAWLPAIGFAGEAVENGLIASRRYHKNCALVVGPA
jgi:hypothetical protein